MTNIDLADNTAARMLRTMLKATVESYEERMLREVMRFQEVAADLDTEIREGMTNRNGDGYQAHEIPKYIERLEARLWGEAVVSHDAIMAATETDKDNMINVINRTKAMPLEQAELAIVRLAAPPVMDDHAGPKA